MLISYRKFFYHGLISHRSLTSKVAAGIVAGAVLIVAIGTVYRPAEALSSVDMKDIKLMSAKQTKDTPSKLLFIETDPALYEQRSPREAAPGISLRENKDVEASMVNGHIQAF
jgi:transcription initiation factor TFIIIB Brf1 subunit/transcription initiation factor TFIIB